MKLSREELLEIMREEPPEAGMIGFNPNDPEYIRAMDRLLDEVREQILLTGDIFI